jgi:hypothetical protein
MSGVWVRQLSSRTVYILEKLLKLNILSRVQGLRVTNKTSFGFDDRIYWTYTLLVTTVHNHTLSSSSDWTLHWNYSNFQLN